MSGAMVATMLEPSCYDKDKPDRSCNDQAKAMLD